MKKQFLHGVLFLATIFFFSFSSSCSLIGGSDDPCGAQINDNKSWTPGEIDLGAHRFYDGDKVYYSFITPTFENVCPDKHMRIAFDFYIKTANKHLFTLEADVTYGILYEYPITGWDESTLDNEYTLYKGIANFGIKNVYGDQPGWFFAYCQISFTSLGTEIADDNFFKDNCFEVSIPYTYNLYN